MDNFVTIETAIKLRDTGFEQPGFKFGQLWMTEDGRNWAFVGTAQFELLKQHFLPEIVFRPTATDILMELGSEFVLWYDESPKISKWLCAKTGNTFHNAGKPFLHNNPAEAAALAYISIHEKK